MKKIRKLLVLLIIIYGLGLIGKQLVQPNTEGIAHFVNKNTLNVKVGDNLYIEKVKIRLSIWATEFENVNIFERGQKRSIPKGYGENDWELSYNEKYQTSFRHFKTKNWFDHDYSFYFYEKDGLIKCDIIIDGPNKMKKTVELNQHSD